MREQNQSSRMQQCLTRKGRSKPDIRPRCGSRQIGAHIQGIGPIILVRFTPIPRLTAEEPFEDTV